MAKKMEHELDTGVIWGFMGLGFRLLQGTLEILEATRSLDLLGT